MSNFSLLWGKILRSSLWVQESKETRLVWITLLALKDKDGVVESSVVGLADSAKVSTDECRDALRVLMSPDPNDTSKVDEGRRIREVRGGWVIVNHEMYRYSSDHQRAYWAIQKAEQRAKKPKKKTAKQVRSENMAREERFCEADSNGEHTEADRIVSEGLDR